MPFTRSPIRHFALLALAAVTFSACGDDSPAAPASVDGRYTATTFLVTPTGQATIDILALGGTLTMTLGPANDVSGTLTVPSLGVEQPALSESLTGTYVRTGNSVRFTQPGDTFVRDLNWSVTDQTLTVVAQQAGGAAFTVTLTRQR